MKQNIAVYAFLLSSTCSLLSVSALAKDCVNCGPGRVAPDASKALQLEKAVKTSLTQDELERKQSYNRAVCMQFDMAQDIWDVEDILEKIEKSPYAASIKEFWTSPVCYVPINNTIKVPILFQVANDTARMHGFAKVVYEYFVEERNDRETWLKAINTPSTDGMTLLDFMQYNVEKGYNRSTGLRIPAEKIIDFICKQGGVYSKYKSTHRCP